MLNRTKKFQLLFKSITKMCSASLDVIGILFITMFTWAAVGQIFWGGKMGMPAHETRTY